MEKETEQSFTHGAEKVIGVIRNNPTTTAVVLLAAGMIIKIAYDKFTAIQALSKDDCLLHENLLKAKEFHFGPNSIPKDWNLVDKKPPVRYEFEDTGKNFKKHALKLNIHNSPDHDARATMLDHIGDLFISMSKRSDFFPVVRTDGIEAMVYIDIADWLIDKAPQLTLDNSNTVTAYKKLLDYCILLNSTVINDRSGEVHRNNPASTMKRLVDILQNYSDKLHAMDSARGFNSLITEVDNELLGFAARSLNILYLLIDPEIPSMISKVVPEKIKNKNYASSTFMIDKFNNPDVNDHKMVVLRETVLGDWLNETLIKGGLTYSKYAPSKTISLDDTETHLHGQHPDDGPMFSPSDKRTGLRPITTKSLVCGKKEDDFLLQIRELNRTTLELYHLSQCLIKGSKVSINFGDIWTYGNPGGSATLAELLSHIKDVTDKYMDTINTFWENYYTNHFLTIPEQRFISVTDEKYTGLNFINEVMKELSAIKIKIDSKIEDIQRKSAAYENNTSEIEQSKIDFMSSVLECRTFYKKTDTVTFNTLKNELIRLKQQKRSDTNNPQKNGNFSEKTGGSTIPKDNKLSKALDCLMSRKRGDCIFTSEYLVVPNIPNNKFYSELQCTVFNKVIKNYNDIINDRFLSGSIYYSAEEFSELRYRYICLYEAYSILYPNDSEKISDHELAEFKNKYKEAIGIVDNQLTQFMLVFELQRLLFKSDKICSQQNLIDINAIRMKKNTDGNYEVAQNSRYDEMGAETTLASIKEYQATRRVFEDISGKPPVFTDNLSPDDNDQKSTESQPEPTMAEANWKAKPDDKKTDIQEVIPTPAKKPTFIKSITGSFSFWGQKKKTKPEEPKAVELNKKIHEHSLSNSG